MSSKRLFGVLVAAALPVFFLFLGSNSIWDANEAFYVETPRQMVERGDYVTPYFNDELRLNKPVLSYWVVALLYKLFGGSVAVERAGIALGALAIIAAAFLVGRALKSTEVGLLAALVVATAPRVVMHSRRIFIDVYVTAFMSMALALLVMALRQPARRRRYVLLMWGAIGLGVLTKGPMAIVLPGIVCVTWMVMEKRWHMLRDLMLPWGAAIVALLVAPWYVELYRQHGWGPIRDFFIGENLNRYASADSSDHRPFWFYLPVLLTDLFPWAPLVVVPLWAGWRQHQAAGDAFYGSIRRLLWVWIVVITGLFSLSQSKQDLYIFSVVPAVAALVADALVGSNFGLSARPIRILLATVAAGCIAAAAVARWLFGSGYYAMDGINMAAVLLGVGALVALGATALSRQRLAVVALAVAFIAFNYVFVGRILPGLERLKPVVPIANVIARRASPTANLGSYHLMLPSLVYYSGRRVYTIGLVDHAKAFFFNDRGGWVIMSEESYNALRPIVPDLCVADRRPIFEFRARDVLSRQPPPDVLLVTNRCAP